MYIAIFIAALASLLFMDIDGLLVSYFMPQIDFTTPLISYDVTEERYIYFPH